MTSDFAQRFTQLIEKLKLSQNAFAAKLETSSSRISNITTGRNKPDSEILAKTIEVFSNVSSKWLLTGEGEMFASSDISTVSESIPFYGSDDPIQKRIHLLEQEVKILREQIKNYQEWLDVLIKRIPDKK
jgi:transcriptional regulator with XRE-family HTH domain